MRSRSVEARRPEEAEARGSVVAEEGPVGENCDGEGEASGERGETGRVKGEATGMIVVFWWGERGRERLREERGERKKGSVRVEESE